ncbi:MAG TPA: hypothetical protein GXX21_09045 [Syntrophomonadaceae bacterium]|nr:hypothetical protein [Syntrophomonadaceae bacterium]
MSDKHKSFVKTDDRLIVIKDRGMSDGAAFKATPSSFCLHWESIIAAEYHVV